MDFLQNEDLLSDFQDLIEGLDTTPLPTDPQIHADIHDVVIDDADFLVHKLEATSLTLADIIVELERRGLQPHGFFSDDAKRLQECYDREHEEYVESKKREMIRARTLEAEELVRRRKKALLDKQIKEEKDEIEGDFRLNEWFRLIFRENCPMNCRIQINDISARCLAKALWTNCNIMSMDVSGMHLSDISGAFLGKALKNNTTLVKYELGGNNFGYKTCKALGEALLLSGNDTLQYLNLESNPLVRTSDGEDDVKGMELLSRAFAKNKSLISVSLWRCFIGIDGGKILAKGISENKSIVCLEVGYNNFDGPDILTMKKQLAINREQRSAKLATESKIAKEQRRNSLLKLEAEKNEQKEEHNSKWLDEQKVTRTETRRNDMEHQRREMLVMKQRQDRMEEIRKMEEARIAEKKKNSNKKGTKGKKGKKGKKDTKGK